MLYSLGALALPSVKDDKGQRLRALQGTSAYLNNVRMELAALTTSLDKERRKNAANEVATRKRMAALQGELDNARQAKYAPCSLINSIYVRATGVLQGLLHMEAARAAVVSPGGTRRRR